MVNQGLNGLESVRPQEHDRQIARNSIDSRQRGRQCTHVETVKTQPREIPTLNGPSPCNLMGTDVDAKDTSGRTHLLGEMKGRKSLTAGNIQNAKARQKIQMLEQCLGKRSGPRVVWRQRPTGCHRFLYHAYLGGGASRNGMING